MTEMFYSVLFTTGVLAAHGYKECDMWPRQLKTWMFIVWILINLNSYMNLRAPVLNTAGVERFIKENSLSLLPHSSYFIVLPKVLHHLYERFSRRLETPSSWFVFNIHWIERRIRNVSFSPLMTKRRKSMVGEVSQALKKIRKECSESELSTQDPEDADEIQLIMNVKPQTMSLQMMISYINSFKLKCLWGTNIFLRTKRKYGIPMHLVIKGKDFIKQYLGFPGGSDGKESACNAGGPGSTPGSGRSPRERNGNPLYYSCLENFMDRRAWWATAHGVAKSQTWLSN